VIAALYLDGGMAAARQFIERYWADMFTDPGQGMEMRDAKTRLQEWAQGRGLAAPAYSEIGRVGPAHAPHFVIEAIVEGQKPERGEGGSKREAEQDAAAKLLNRLSS
jgi:ribonuclease-3